MLKLILYIVVGLVVLSFFGVSVQHVIESPTTQENFAYLGDLLEEGWNTLTSEITGLWESIV